MNQLTKTLTVIILLCLTFSTFSGAIVFVQACDPASKLVFSSGAPQVLQAGAVSNQITVQLQDTSNKPVNALSDTIVNLATNASSSGHFYSDQNGKNQISGITIKEGQNSANFYYKDTLAGHPTLTATSAGLTAATTIFSVTSAAGGATHFVVSAPSSAAAGASFSISVTAKDQYGNTVTSYSGTIHFTSTDGQAVLPANSGLTNGVGSFSVTLKTAGSQTVTATDTGNSAITGVANLNVAPAALDGIVINPNQASITAGNTQTFTAEELDQYGNSLGDVTSAATWTTSTGASVTAPGNVTANLIGSYLVTATFNGMTAEATLTVTAAGLDHIGVSESSGSVAAGSGETLTVTSYDAYDNPIADVTSGCTFTIGGVTVSNPVVEDTAGPYTVTVSYSGVPSVTASWTVTAAGLDHITISPASPSIVAGTSQVFTVQAFDVYGNSLGDVTSSAMFTAPGATVTGNSVSANLVGSYTVTATYSGKSDSTTLTVTAAGLNHITVSLSSSSVAAPGTVTGTATAYDSFGNSWDISTLASWSIPAGGDGGSWSGNVYTSNTAGTYTVQASYMGKIATASLTVTHATDVAYLDKITIAPKDSTVPAGVSQSYTATAYDQFGNTWPCFCCWFLSCGCCFSFCF